jgi:hypothetical protein
VGPRVKPEDDSKGTKRQNWTASAAIWDMIAAIVRVSGDRLLVAKAIVAERRTIRLSFPISPTLGNIRAARSQISVTIA